MKAMHDAPSEDKVDTPSFSLAYWVAFIKDDAGVGEEDLRVIIGRANLVV